jgi:hypothetical protein
VDSDDYAELTFSVSLNMFTLILNRWVNETKEKDSQLLVLQKHKSVFFSGQDVDFYLSVLTVRSHFCVSARRTETGLAKVLDVIGLGQVKPGAQAKHVRFQRGSCNVDPVRIIINRPPYTCIASSSAKNMKSVN